MIHGMLLLFRLICTLGIALDGTGDINPLNVIQPPSDSTVVVLLGIGNPYPDPERQWLQVSCTP
jgi:hypothetical protein